MTFREWNRRGVTVAIDWTEILIAALLIIIGILLVFGFGSLEKSKAEARAAAALDNIHGNRVIVNALSLPGGTGMSVADRIILSRYDATEKTAVEDGLDQQDIGVVEYSGGGIPANTVLLPTLDGQVLAVHFQAHRVFPGASPIVMKQK